MDSRQVVISPVVSEKSYALIAQNKYTFRVHPDAHKTQIRQAVEEIFDVTVTDVRTMLMKPKPKRRGWTPGKTRGWKKAIVELAPGNRIELFEGAAIEQE
jgi:large subunit ribosomal protein L23